MEKFGFQRQKDQPCFLSLLSLRWENSLERNTEIKHQIRLHIGMRLAATNVGDGAGMHHLISLARRVHRLAIIGPEGTCGVPKGCINVAATNAQIAGKRVRVLGQLTYVYGDG
jgi:hypothetical protein